MRVYVGADWSANEIAVATLTDRNEKPRKWGKTGRSIREVQVLMQRLRKEYPQAQSIHVVIETGTTGWPEMLHEAGAVVHVVDARQAKRFAESLSSSGAKDDARDAAVLAQLCQERSSRLDVWSTEDPELAQLRALSIDHELATTQSTQARQRLRSLLSETFPTLNRVLGDVQKLWVERLLRLVPTRAHAARVHRPEFDLAMKGTRPATREQVWTCLQNAGMLQIDVQRGDVLARRVERMLDQIKYHRERLKELERQLDEASTDFESRDRVESVPGLGMKLATRLILMVFHKMPTHRDEAGITMGACPVFDGSGTLPDGRPKGTVKMRRAGDSRARATTYLIGRLAVQRLPWAQARYAHDRAKNKSAATSYRSIARSLLRILSALVISGEDYDDARYVERLKVQGVPWAMKL